MGRRWRWGLVCALLLGGVVGVQAPSVARGEGAAPVLLYAGCGGVQVAPLNADYEQEVVERTNAERASRGLPPLKREASLEYAARYHAADMAQDDYFQHDTYDRQGGSLVAVCNTWARIASLYDGFANAENIGAGYGSPAAAVQGWMDSSGHRDNLLNPTSREIGVGYSEGGSWGRYWVQNFGLSDDVYPLIINGEARQTGSTAVTLYLYGPWSEMRLRNDSDPWGPWQPFRSSLAWTLSPRDGLRTVSAEMRQGGQTVGASDTIWLSGAAPRAKVFLPVILTRFDGLLIASR